MPKLEPVSGNRNASARACEHTLPSDKLFGSVETGDAFDSPTRVGIEVRATRNDLVINQSDFWLNHSSRQRFTRFLRLWLRENQLSDLPLREMVPARFTDEEVESLRAFLGNLEKEKPSLEWYDAIHEEYGNEQGSLLRSIGAYVIGDHEFLANKEPIFPGFSFEEEAARQARFTELLTALLTHKARDLRSWVLPREGIRLPNARSEIVASLVVAYRNAGRTDIEVLIELERLVDGIQGDFSSLPRLTKDIAAQSGMTENSRDELVEYLRSARHTVAPAVQNWLINEIFSPEHAHSTRSADVEVTGSHLLKTLHLEEASANER